ncbi:MAG: hypothetical protein O2904_03550 [bacterium]|nr:hypothetical protein [bacterium]
MNSLDPAKALAIKAYCAEVRMFDVAVFAAMQNLMMHINSHRHQIQQALRSSNDEIEHRLNALWEDPSIFQEKTWIEVLGSHFNSIAMASSPEDQALVGAEAIIYLRLKGTTVSIRADLLRDLDQKVSIYLYDVPIPEHHLEMLQQAVHECVITVALKNATSEEDPSDETWDLIEAAREQLKYMLVDADPEEQTAAAA